jgi:hypothetical protein
MLNRHRVTIERAIIAGDVQRPQHTYTLDNDRNIFQYFWSEPDIVAAHQFFATVHQGPPRKDGMITPRKMPTLRELRAMIRQEEVLYVKNDKGEFVPVWRAQDFS